ncbi:MAG: hypothetical protein RLW61_22015 [Gammaproteobacteria bacterium]
MGEEIATTTFCAADFERFAARLDDETAALAALFEAGTLSDSGYTWGFELEAWLLDHGLHPTPVNAALLDALGRDDVVPELSRFNVELNTAVRDFAPHTFSAAERDLTTQWSACNAVAHGLDANMVAIGSLPTIRDADLSIDNISPLKRYYALNHELLAANRGRPLQIRIEGRERLTLSHADVMLEAAATSFQVHLKTPWSLAHRYYNASLALSAPVLAAAANAPLLFDRLLWEETRIPLFEQAIAGVAGPAAAVPRVTFGSGYLDHTLFECFAENRRAFPVLLPIGFDESPAALRHLRLHNGTIWRWNRPLVGFDGDGVHVRLEHRALPAGPSLADMIANAALYLGATHEWVMRDCVARVTASDARANFYAAARHGLDATLRRDGGTCAARAWLLDEIVDDADAGLARLGIAAEERARYLGIVRARVASGQTGAAWQRACYLAQGRDAYALMAAYCELQRSGAPVHEWPRPGAAR